MPMSPKAEITAARLTRLANGAPADLLVSLAPQLNAQAERFEISTPRRVRHWLAQLAHESGGFRRLEENLVYTSAARICAVWPRRFPTLASALPYVRNPRALAEKVYGGRMGNSVPGDGWRYRGRGLEMRTGRAGYAAAGRTCGLPLEAEPELLATPSVAAVSAAAYWAERGLNALADADAGETIFTDTRAAVLANEEDDLRSITYRINGGDTGLADRRNWLIRAAAIWTD